MLGDDLTLEEKVSGIEAQIKLICEDLDEVNPASDGEPCFQYRITLLEYQMDRVMERLDKLEKNEGE